MLTKDKLWKAILEDFFPESIKFFLLSLYQKIDWSKGYKVLDKELAQLFPESQTEHRRVDFLAEVTLLDGTEQWILIHIEIQGYREVDFPKRFFSYHYRLMDRFDKPIASLALLTDPHPNWKPSRYEFSFFGTNLLFEYPIFKLSEWREEDFAESKNPWVIILKIGKIGLRSNWDDPSLLEMKVKLYRELRGAGLTIEQTRRIFNFLKSIVPFKKSEFRTTFDSEIQIVNQQKSLPMGMDALIAQHEYEEGVKDGIEKGIEQGIERGIVLPKDEIFEIWKLKNKSVQVEKAVRIKIEKMLMKGLAPEQVADLLEEELELVQKIRQRMAAEN